METGDKQQYQWINRLVNGFSLYSDYRVVTGTSRFIFFLDYVSELVNSALSECDYHKLGAAFLVERQAALEGAHVFKPYVVWFEVS